MFTSKSTVLINGFFISFVLWLFTTCFLYLAEHKNLPHLFPHIPGTMFMGVLMVCWMSMPYEK
jgi:hypothetical protein